MSENNIDNNKNNDSGDRKHDEEDQMIEQPTPLPVLKAEDAHVEHHEEKSKYQEELEKNKKKSSFFNKKKSVEIKATSKVTRSDVLSKLEEADLKDQNNPHNQKYMPFDGFKGPACIFVFINLIFFYSKKEKNRLFVPSNFHNIEHWSFHQCGLSFHTRFFQSFNERNRFQSGNLWSRSAFRSPILILFTAHSRHECSNVCF